jgi:hypothetical protein
MEKRLFEIVGTIAEAAVPTTGDVRPLTPVLANTGSATDCEETSFSVFDDF